MKPEESVDYSLRSGGGALLARNTLDTMAGKPLIVQVCFPGGGYKKVAFQRNMNVNDARDMLAEKAQKMDSKEDYGLFIAPTNVRSNGLCMWIVRIRGCGHRYLCPLMPFVVDVIAAACV